MMDRLNNHVAGEGKVYANNEFDASVALSVDNIVKASSDGNPSRIASEMQGGFATIRVRAGLEGWPKEQTEMAMQEFQSKAHAGVIGQMLVDNKSTEARTYFMANQDDMTLQDKGKFVGTMQQININQASQAHATAIETGVASSDSVWHNMRGKESGHRQFDSSGAPLLGPVLKGKSERATGIAQVLPSTAQETARKHGIVYDENKFKTDALYNENIGRLYFDDLVKKYGDPAIAAAAYNAGPGTVDGWLKDSDPRKGGISMAEWVAQIPYAETRDYVQTVASGGGGARNRTMTEKIAEARNISDPDVQKQTIAIIKENEQVAEYEKNQQTADVTEQLDRHFASGGSMTTLPPQLRSAALEYAPKQLLSYESVAASGGLKTTDQLLYSDMIMEATNQPLKFKDRNLKLLLPKLSDSDFQELVKMKGSIIAGRNNQIAAMNKTIQNITYPMMVDVGLMTKKGAQYSVPNSEEKKKLHSMFYSSMRDQMQAYKAKYGKDPNVNEVKAMADGLLMQTTVEKNIIFADEKKFAFEETLPVAARSKLKEGVPTTFQNGQTWVLKNGLPTRTN